MMTLGLCNIFGSFVQAMPTCGAFTRSAVSNASGVRTPLAGLYTGTNGLCSYWWSFFKKSLILKSKTIRHLVYLLLKCRLIMTEIFVTGTLIILALTFLTPYFYFIPKATLSAVLICAVMFMVDYQIIKPLWKSNSMSTTTYQAICSFWC